MLHLFTGTHDDYHKPTDDAEKINYKGMAKLASLIYTITARTANYENSPSKNHLFRTEDHAELLRDLRSRARLPFWRARASYRRGDRRAPRGQRRVEGGDVIMKIGDIAIDDIYAYMTALGAFKKGDTTALVYVRDGEEVETEITF